MSILRTKVNLQMGSPVALRNWGLPTGDALLFAVAVRNLHPNADDRKDPAEWDEIPLPICKVPGQEFYACSQLIADEEPANGVDGYFKRTSAEILLKNDQVRGPRKSGDFALNVYFFRNLHFYVDIEEAQKNEFVSLLNQLSLFSIGAKRNIGYGKIVKVSADIAGVESSIMTDTRHALRPLPVAFAEANGITGIRSFGAVVPPYHGPGQQDIIVPTIQPYVVETKAV